MEIKTQELRVGNYVSESYSGSIFKVVNINSEGFGFIDMHHINFKAIGRYEITSIKPIQLTEELLLKCGAKETESYTYEFTQVGKDIDLCVKFCEYDICVTIWQNNPIYLRYDFVDFYLHTLQNLIFALTGEELTYNQSQDI